MMNFDPDALLKAIHDSNKKVMEVAEEIGIDRSRLYNYYSGKIKPSSTTLKILESYFGTPMIKKESELAKNRLALLNSLTVDNDMNLSDIIILHENKMLSKNSLKTFKESSTEGFYGLWDKYMENEDIYTIKNDELFISIVNLGTILGILEIDDNK